MEAASEARARRRSEPARLRPGSTIPGTRGPTPRRPRSPRHRRQPPERNRASCFAGGAPPPPPDRAARRRCGAARSCAGFSARPCVRSGAARSSARSPPLHELLEQAVPIRIAGRLTLVQEALEIVTLGRAGCDVGAVPLEPLLRGGEALPAGQVRAEVDLLPFGMARRS